MDAQEETVEAVTHQVAIELPIPPDTVVQPPAFDGGTVEKIRVPVAANDGGAPPVGERAGCIVGGQARIPVAGKSLVVFVCVKLHVVGNLAQVIQADRTLAL